MNGLVGKILVKLLISSSWMLSEEQFLKIFYQIKTGKKLDLEKPKTYNEKLQWLKLYYHRPELTTMVDKVKVKDYVKAIIGEEYIIPTIGVWERAEDIDFSKLPNSFVIKCNHNSGMGMCICRNKDEICIDNVREKLKKGISQNYYNLNHEWPYKNVERRILAEELLVNNSPDDHEIHDYKFYCFNGKVAALLVSNDRSTGKVKFDYFDRDFNHLPFTQGGENYKGEIKRPDNLDLMIELAEKLSKGYPHLRVDFYDVNGKVYFGELTFFDSSGFAKFNPEEWDRRWGDLIILPEEKII